MSNIPLETPADAPLGPIRTPHQLLADELIKEIDAIAAKVPQLEFPHATTVHFVRQYQGIRMPFLATAVSAVETTPVLAAFNKLDVVRAREAFQFMEAMKPVLDRIRSLFNSVRFTIAAQKSFVAADALQVYAIAKGVSRDPGSAHVSEIVLNLRRDLGPRGRRAAGEEEPEASKVSGPRS